MIAEARAVQADVAARAVFARDGESIRDTRHVIAAHIAGEDQPDADDEPGMASFASALMDGSLEVG